MSSAIGLASLSVPVEAAEVWGAEASEWWPSKYEEHEPGEGSLSGVLMPGCAAVVAGEGRRACVCWGGG